MTSRSSIDSAAEASGREPTQPPEPPGVIPLPVEPQTPAPPETTPPLPDTDEPGAVPEEYPDRDDGATTLRWGGR